MALVTGGARGIGAATARLLSTSGWRVVIFDRCSDAPSIAYHLASPEDLERTVDQCGGPLQAIGVQGDVRDQGALDRAVGAAIESFGGLDAAVAAAGCIRGGEPAWEASDEAWSEMIGTNLEGVWRLARAAVPALLARPEPRHGRFVAVSSAGGLVGLPLLGAYCAAKAGVIGLIRSLASELGRYGITANAVAPGSTATTMLDASATVYGLAEPAEFAQHHLLPRLLDPTEPAALLAWLCGADATGITGAVIPVDAGMTAH